MQSNPLLVVRWCPKATSVRIPADLPLASVGRVPILESPFWSQGTVDQALLETWTKESPWFHCLYFELTEHLTLQEWAHFARAARPNQKGLETIPIWVWARRPFSSHGCRYPFPPDACQKHSAIDWLKEPSRNNDPCMANPRSAHTRRTSHFCREWSWLVHGSRIAWRDCPEEAPAADESPNRAHRRVGDRQWSGWALPLSITPCDSSGRSKESDTQNEELLCDKKLKLDHHPSHKYQCDAVFEMGIARVLPPMYRWESYRQKLDGVPWLGVFFPLDGNQPSQWVARSDWSHHPAQDGRWHVLEAPASCLPGSKIWFFFRQWSYHQYRQQHSLDCEGERPPFSNPCALESVEWIWDPAQRNPRTLMRSARFSCRSIPNDRAFPLENPRRHHWFPEPKSVQAECGNHNDDPNR